MPITSVDKDPDALTMTVVADFAAPLERLWDAYADPRQLEQFWGPPTYPATFTRHDMFPGGRSAYVMTGPDGDESRGYWEFLAVEPPQSFEVRDGFATPTATAEHRDAVDADDLRASRPPATGSRVTTTTHFDSLDELEQLVTMGMEEGMREAMGQIDAVLADLRHLRRGRPREPPRSSATPRCASAASSAARSSRCGTPTTSPDLLQRWLLGPDGWTMPVCEMATEVGETYRYEWEAVDGSRASFGFTGELLEMRRRRTAPSRPSG